MLLLLTATGLNAQESKKLTGTVIGTEKSINYNTGQSSTTVNTRANAFDGDLNTFFGFTRTIRLSAHTTRRCRPSRPT